MLSQAKLSIREIFHFSDYFSVEGKNSILKTMLRFLIVDNNSRVLEILEKSLKKDFRAEVQCCHSSIKAIELLKENLYDLVVVRNQVVDQEGIIDEVAKKILAFYYDHNMELAIKSLVCLGEVETALTGFEVLPERFRIEELNRLVVKLTGISKDELQLMKKPDYVPFYLRDFFLFTKCPCDFYIKMNRKDGAHFVKRMKRGDETDRESVVRYLNSGVESFYIQREDWDDLINGIFIALTQLVYQENHEFEDWIEKASDIYFLSKDLIFCTEEVSSAAKDLTKEFVLANRNALISHADVYPLVEKTFYADIPFESKFFALQMVLYFHLIGKLEFGEKLKNEKGLEQVIFLCFFKDIYLKDDIEYLINTKEKLKKQADVLTADQVSRIENHAMMASNLIQKFNHVPAGTDVIIRQHHGLPNGVGLTDQLTVAISPQAMQLMVVEDFVLLILALEEKTLSKELLHLLSEQLLERFTGASYRKIVHALSSLF